MTKEEIQKYADELAYEAWKMMNEKFMKRYIEDLIMQDELTFSFGSSYNGNFTMVIRMGDKFLTSVDGYININENTLEW